MSDYILRDVAIIEFMDNDIDHIQAPNGKEAVQILQDIPTVDVVQVVHGHWIDKNGNIIAPFWERYECSICGARSDNSNFCPNCGAKMDAQG